MSSHLNRAQRILTNYSGVILSKIPNKLQSLDAIYHTLIRHPLEYHNTQIPVHSLIQDITHIPLIEDPHTQIRTKMIVWKPNSKSEIHSHFEEYCFFQAIYPLMRQEIYISNDPLDTLSLEISNTQFSFISDEIGPHSMMNTDPQHTNVTFHMYVPYQSVRKMIWEGTPSPDHKDNHVY